MEKFVIKVSSSSPVPNLASSIAMSVKEGKDVELRAIGAAAVNQMYKAIAAARGILASKGKDLYIRPGFSDLNEDGGKWTVITADIVFK